MDIAKAMVQARGYNGLSFRELAKEVGVKSASIHYHFPTKGDLAAAIARRYTEDGLAYLSNLSAEKPDMQSCFTQYTDIFRGSLVNNNRMCLCGMMAAEYEDLPADVRIEVESFTAANVKWLAETLISFLPDIEVHLSEERALAIFAAIEGAQLVARAKADVGAFDTIISAYRTSGLLP